MTLAGLAAAPLRAALEALRAGTAGSAPFAMWLEWLAGLAALCCAGWLWAVVTVVTASAALGTPAATRAWVPGAVHRSLAAACGVVLAGGLAGPAVAHDALAEPAAAGRAHADGAPADGARPTTLGAATGATVVAGLALPDRAETGPPRRPAPPVAPWVVVAPGDTLWSLAASILADGAPDARVSLTWQRLYRLNRAAVGADPDLIRPGLRLRLAPPAGPASTRAGQTR